MLAAGRHKRHNMRFGVDFHRIHADSIGGTAACWGRSPSRDSRRRTRWQACSACNTNPISTTNPNPTCTCERIAGGGPAAGAAAADWHHGRAEQDLPARQLVGLVWNGRLASAQSNLTFEFGLRWEYFSPYSEKYNRLVNLDVDRQRQRSAIANVCAHLAPGRARLGCGTPGLAGESGQVALLAAHCDCVVAEVQVDQEYGGAVRLRDQLQHRRSIRGSRRNWRSSSRSRSRRRTRRARRAARRHARLTKYDAEQRLSTASTARRRRRRATTASIRTTIWAWCRSTTWASSGLCRRASC
jgi:hypothetical protein